MTSRPESITDLFERSPLEWDEPAMTRMVAYMRGLRVQLKESEAAGKRAPKPAAIPKEDLTGISGGDLLGKLGLS